MKMPHSSIYCNPPVIRNAAAAFSPSQISGLQLWLSDSSTLWQNSARTTPAVSDGDPIGSWDDLSGLGNHVKQGTSANKPTLKLAILNGRNVVRLDGVNDTLTNTLFAGLNGLSGRTAFAVYLQPSAQQGTLFQLGDSSGTNCTAQMQPWSDSKTYDGVASSQPSCSSLIGSWALACSTFDGTQTGDANRLVVRHNGVQQTLTFGTAVPATTPVATGCYIGTYNGTGGPFGGSIAEIIVYASALSASDRATVEAFLNGKYAIY